MHETDMTQALILTVQDWVSEQPNHPPIKTVHLTVGEFTGVEPASLQFAFQVQRQNTCLSEAELVIEDVPLVAFCHPCQREYRPTIGQQYSCPTCRSPLEDIRSGRELRIDRIEFVKTAAALETAEITKATETAEIAKATEATKVEV